MKRATLLLILITVLLLLILLLLPNSGRQPDDKTVADDSPADSIQTGKEELQESEEPEAVASEMQRDDETRVKDGARLVIIIDDAGNNLGDIDAFLSFPDTITFSVLPQLPESRGVAEKVMKYGKEVILHFPMESVNGVNPGPGALFIDQSEKEKERLINDNFASIPPVAGTSNHMGSLATADEETMRTVMDYLYRNDKFFLDSKTTADSVAERIASLYDVPYLKRDVFIDNNPSDREEMIRNINNGVELARSEGYAILIGHAQNAQLGSLLNELYSNLIDEGIQFCGVSEILSDVLSYEVTESIR